MREIKFRGEHIETGRWVYGYYVCTHNRHRIIYEDYEGFYCEEEVIPETVGQYTGLKDKNGCEIYEGDVLKNDYGELWVVVWEGTGFMLALFGDSKNIYSANEYYFSSCEVIGNIYENLELLEGEE